jgi:phenylacetic acid degradation operon negative regulatory protein
MVVVATAERISAVRPRSQILYIYGGFVRRLGGWLRVSTLLDLMADLGVEPLAVRAAVARMKRVGLLASSRRQGVAGYALTPRAWQILDEGDRRILTAREPANLVDGWVLVIFSVPESQRDRRHQLRSQLSWLGFGSIASGAWIAPQRLRTEVEATLKTSRLLEFTERFDVTYGDVEASRRLVHKCWDLAQLDGMYRQFISRWNAILDTTSPVTPPRTAFQTYIAVIADWRRLPFLDPGLPRELLPQDWQGETARSIYFSLLARIDEPALNYVRDHL